MEATKVPSLSYSRYEETVRMSGFNIITGQIYGWENSNVQTFNRFSLWLMETKNGKFQSWKQNILIYCRIVLRQTQFFSIISKSRSDIDKSDENQQSSGFLKSNEVGKGSINL